MAKLSLAFRNLIFTVIVPGTGALYAPWWILTHGGPVPRPAEWSGIVPIVVGLALYGWCVWLFATLGRGTPGPWDAPRHLVAIGPYRWVRNPIYIGALLVITGEALLFLSWSLLLYAAVAALAVHLFVIGYEEPALRRTFGDEYLTYQRSVSRWLPRPPRG